MRQFRISHCPVDTDVFRHTPELVDRIAGVLGQNAVLENQASAFMYCERTEAAVHMVELRHTQPGASGTERVSGVIAEHGRIVRLDDRAIIHPDVINGLDPLPVQRFLQTTAVVDQHDSNGTTKESCPFDACHGDFFPIQLVESLLIERLNFLVRDVIQLKAMLDGLLSRSVDDLGEQAVALVKHGQGVVGYIGFRNEVVMLRGILRCAVAVH